MAKLSIKAAQIWSGAFTISFVVLLGGWAAYRSHSVEIRWDDFEKSTMKQNAAITSASAALGDAVQNFKNYVLRGKDHAEKFSQDMAQLERAAGEYRASAGLQEEEIRLLAELDEKSKAYRGAMTQLVSLRAARPDITQTELDKAVEGRSQAIQAVLAKLSEINSHDAATDSADLRDTLRVMRVQIMVLAALTVLLVLAGVFVLSRRITHALDQVAGLANSVSSGRLDNYIPSDHSGELGRLYGALAGMQTGLRERIERDHQMADESLRIKIALDNVSANVMVADPERRIIYLNKAVEGMFRNAETDIRKQLPQFDAGKLLGASIDGFHKNPQHQAQLLASFTSTYRSTLHIGGRTMTVVANPVLNERGERLGSVVEWADRTLEVAAEKEIADLVSAAGAGDFSQRLATGGKDGFFLQLASGINKLVETSERGMSDVARVLKALSTGDLSKRMEGDYQGLFGQLKDDTNATSERLSEIVAQIREATDAINTAAREIASGNSDLSSRTESQASSLEETASSMDEITSTVKQNADNARQANQLSKGASEVAVKGGEVVGQVVHTMGAIAESSKKIADIISVIDGIAFQTNILALNAAVEAARAGEQGRGFAVVAGEVRNLAQRSAAAAKEIKELIGNSVDKVSDGYRLVENAGKTMDEIVGAVKRVTDIMGEITAASQEQSQGIEQVNGAIAQMDEMTQQNAALVEEAAAAAESLQDQAAGLSESVSVFKLAEGSTRLPAPDAVPRLTSRPVAGARPRAGLKPHKPASLTQPRTPSTST